MRATRRRSLPTTTFVTADVYIHIDSPHITLFGNKKTQENIYIYMQREKHLLLGGVGCLRRVYKVVFYVHKTYLQNVYIDGDEVDFFV